MRDLQKVELPAGTHSEVLLGEHRKMVTVWTEVTEKNERSILEAFGMNMGRSMVETVGALAYASVSRTAWSLASVAEIQRGDFDPVEFGRRCEAIAREQIERYRRAKEAGEITDGVVLERSALFAAMRQS